MSRIRENLEELAMQILLDNDMLYKTPVRIIEIAKSYGIKVYEEKLDNEVSGAIRYNDKIKKFEILANQNNIWTRKRFTIAHELGHYFLHQDMLKRSDVHIDTLYRTTTQIDEKTKEQEKEVDYLAGALLMNKIVVEKLIEDNYTIEELAEIFDVSGSAMTVRLDILGLL